MKLTLGFSPCPNDTFIFDALVNKKIDTEGLDFEVILEDVETLNQWAGEEKLDITKLSFPAVFQNPDKYILLNSGAALGKGVGPLLITNSASPFNKGRSDHYDDLPVSPAEIEMQSIALPGEHTTANFLFSFAFPNAREKIFLRYNEIEDWLMNTNSPQGELGVIIHESRFTYQQKGLHKILDLGEYWEQKMKLPIPLGGIGIKKKFVGALAVKIDLLIRKSLEYGFKNYPMLPEFVKQNAQELSEEIMRQHIGLYVNNYSLELGVEGKKAISAFYRVFCQLHSLSPSSSQLFLS